MSLITVALTQFDNVTTLLSYRRCDDKTVIIIRASIITTFCQDKTKTKHRYVLYREICFS